MAPRPGYPAVRYFREADGRIGCWTIESVADEQTDWYDNPSKVPELAPAEAETPLADSSSDEARPATPAPIVYRGRRK